MLRFRRFLYAFLAIAACFIVIINQAPAIEEANTNSQPSPESSRLPKTSTRSPLETDFPHIYHHPVDGETRGQCDTKYPLAPPDTSSPQAALNSFMREMNCIQHLVLSIYYGREDDRIAVPEKAEEHAEEALERAVEILDLSEVPEANIENKGKETALLLKELLDEVLPLQSNGEQNKAADDQNRNLIAWQVPSSKLVLVRNFTRGNRNSFVFSKETVEQAREFYKDVREFYDDIKGEEPAPNCKPRVRNGSYQDEFCHDFKDDFYKFYISEPGGLVPPWWGSLMPIWSDRLVFDQTLWQWAALVLTCLCLGGAIATLYYLLRFRLHQTGSVSGAWISLSIPTAILLLCLAAKEFLDKQINLTGHVLIWVRAGALLGEYCAGAGLAFLLFNALGISILRIRWFRTKILEQTMMRNGFRLLGIVAGVTVVAFGFEKIGIPIEPLLASLGAGSLALSFGLQPYIQDVIGGITLFANRTMKIGDFCEFGGVSGTIEDIDLRFTSIRTIDRRLITIPNANVSATVVNHSRRDKFVLEQQLELAEATPVQQVPDIMAALSDRLASHEVVEGVNIQVLSMGHDEGICLGVFGLRIYP